jgi:Flp pilus assembly pilin Flp
MNMRAILKRLLIEDQGQDLVEYALLVAFVGFMGLLAWLAIQASLANGYVAMDGNEQDLAATTPPPQ